MEHLKGSSIGQAPVLPTNIRPSWKGLPGDKHSSLLQTFVNYRRKKFYTIGPNIQSNSSYQWYKCKKGGKAYNKNTNLAFKFCEYNSIKKTVKIIQRG
jgi:hypothetical protein